MELRDAIAILFGMASLGLSILTSVRVGRTDNKQDIEKSIKNALNAFILEMDDRWVGRRELKTVLHGINHNVQKLYELRNLKPPNAADLSDKSDN